MKQIDNKLKQRAVQQCFQHKCNYLVIDANETTLRRESQAVSVNPERIVRKFTWKKDEVVIEHYEQGKWKLDEKIKKGKAQAATKVEKPANKVKEESKSQDLPAGDRPAEAKGI